VFGLFSRRFGARALLSGWAVGIVAGTWIAFGDGIKPVHTLHLGETSLTLYTGLLALAVNVMVALVVQAVAGGPAAALRREVDQRATGGVIDSEATHG
jgi:SSS family solute:Na+ symporter